MRISTQFNHVKVATNTRLIKKKKTIMSERSLKDQ